MTDTLAAAFQKYRELMIPAAFPLEIVYLSERAFYGGAMAMFDALISHLDTATEEEQIANIEALRLECLAFADRVAAGVMVH